MDIIHLKTFLWYRISVYKKNENPTFPRICFFIILSKTDSEAYVFCHNRYCSVIYPRQIVEKMVLNFIRNAVNFSEKKKSLQCRSQESFLCKGARGSWYKTLSYCPSSDQNFLSTVQCS